MANRNQLTELIDKINSMSAEELKEFVKQLQIYTPPEKTQAESNTVSKENN